jgi:hypothetical protein
VEAGLDAVTRFEPVRPVTPAPTSDPAVRRLVACAHFLLDEVQPGATGDRWQVGGDDGCHFLAVIAGSVRFADEWALPPLGRGACVLVPASAGRQEIAAEPTAGEPARLLRVCLP